MPNLVYLDSNLYPKYQMPRTMFRLLVNFTNGEITGLYRRPNFSYFFICKNRHFQEWTCWRAFWIEERRKRWNTARKWRSQRRRSSIGECGIGTKWRKWREYAGRQQNRRYRRDRTCRAEWGQRDSRGARNGGRAQNEHTNSDSEQGYGSSRDRLL